MPYYSQDATSIDLNTVQSNLGLSGQRSMNDNYIRYYAGRAGSGTSISFSDFRNTSAVTIPSLNTTYTVATSYTKIYHVPGNLSSYGTGEFQYAIESYSDVYGSSSFGAQYSASDVWLRVDASYATATVYDSRPYGYCNAPGRGYQSFIIPIGCSSVLIKAWGGGGGSGGSYTSGSTPGYGGGGGYATTTLIVGTHCSIGQVLHCFAGLGGGGAGQLWFGGQGGTASYVGLTTKAFGNEQIDERSWGTPGISLLNSSVFGPTNAVLIAGGGGGGGGINSSGNKAGDGGGGGEASSGSGGGGEYSGSGTGGTTTSHGAGVISDISNQICGVAGGGRIKHPSRTVWDEASIATILGNSVVGTAYNQSDALLGQYKTRCGGGGGAFQGSPDWRTVGSGSTNARNIGRGGGGGSNKIYKGTNQSISNGSSSGTPGNSAYAGSYGYGSTSKGANNGDNYGGAPGRAGKIEIIFS